MLTKRGRSHSIVTHLPSVRDLAELKSILDSANDDGKTHSRFYTCIMAQTRRSASNHVKCHLVGVATGNLTVVVYTEEGAMPTIGEILFCLILNGIRNLDT